MNTRTLYLWIIVLVITAWSTDQTFGQSIDSTKAVEPVSTKVKAESKKEVTQDTLLGRSPARAALFSAVLPGLGQAYNGKYWKVPIVYAGMGTSVFFILDNRKNYRHYRDNYLAEVDTDPNTNSTLDSNFTSEFLREQADQYRQWMELSYVVLAGFYILNIVDASVDAHLSTFDVSDDLSLRVAPSMFPAMGTDRMYMGFSLQLNFKR